MNFNSKNCKVKGVSPCMCRYFPIPSPKPQPEKNPKGKAANLVPFMPYSPREPSKNTAKKHILLKENICILLTLRELWCRSVLSIWNLTSACRVFLVWCALLYLNGCPSEVCRSVSKGRQFTSHVMKPFLEKDFSFMPVETGCLKKIKTQVTFF